MGQIGDRLTAFLYWLWPPLKKERDLLLDKLQDYRQRIQEAESLASRLVIENQRLKTQVEAATRPDQPKIFKAATAADVRRMTEQAFALSEDKDGI